MPSNVPRSQTGLVPRSHHLQMDRKSSSNNYRQLPPRPPPEVYPFRGKKSSVVGKDGKKKSLHRSGVVGKNSNSSVGTKWKKDDLNTSQCSPCRSSNHPDEQNEDITGTSTKKKSPGSQTHSKRGVVLLGRNKSISTKKNGPREQNNRNQKVKRGNLPLAMNRQTTRKIEEWDLYSSDKDAHKFSKAEQSGKENSKKAVLTYLRKSARNRAQIEDLERQLHLELEFENEILQGSSDEQDSRNHCFNDASDANRTSSVLTDLKNLKHSILKICEDSKEVDYHHFNTSTMVSSANNSINKSHFNLSSSAILNEAMSLQSEETSSSSLNHTYQVEKSSSASSKTDDTYCYLPKDHFGSDIKRDQGNELSNCIMASKENNIEQEHSSQLLNNETFWGGLSQDQMVRIRRRMQEMCEADSNKKPYKADNKKEAYAVEAHQHKRDESCETENKCYSETCGSLDKSKGDSSYLSKIASHISETLYSPIRDAVQEDTVKTIKTNHERKNLNDDPKPMPTPAHPFAMPLAKELRELLKK